MPILAYQPIKVLAEKVLPTGKMILVKQGNEKPKWVWQNKLPKEVVNAWAEHLGR